MKIPPFSPLDEYPTIVMYGAAPIAPRWPEPPPWYPWPATTTTVTIPCPTCSGSRFTFGSAGPQPCAACMPEWAKKWEERETARDAEIARLKAEVERLTPKKPAGVESPLLIWHERHEAHHGGCPFCRNPEPAPTPKPPPDYWIVRRYRDGEFRWACGGNGLAVHRRGACRFDRVEHARATAEWWRRQGADIVATVIAVRKRGKKS